MEKRNLARIEIVSQISNFSPDNLIIEPIRKVDLFRLVFLSFLTPNSFRPIELSFDY